MKRICTFGLLCAIYLAPMALAKNGLSLGKNSERQAYDKAKTYIVEKYRNQVLSIFGKGSPDAISTWYINFYDPDSPNKGRVVLIQDGKVERVYPAKASSDVSQSFDPTMIRAGVDAALKTARQYAKENQIAYDEATVLLRRTEPGKAPVWRVELIQGGRSHGFVYTKAPDASFAHYEPPSGRKDFGKEVEDTFLGIGGDLEEFFTGERTVDR